MLTGIEIIIERMKTHPEEFVGTNGGCSKEWYRVFNPVVPYLTDEEKEAVNAALFSAHRDYFNGEVMRVISGEAKVDESISTYTEDYYGRSLANMINGTDSRLIGVQTPTQAAIVKTRPSAFGAVPIATLTSNGSS